MPSALGSREPQKANTIVILQPINIGDIRLIAADISSGMLTCAIVCLDALHVGNPCLAMEPVLTACLDRHLITAPVGTTLVIGPDIEVRVKRFVDTPPKSSVSVFERGELTSIPEAMKSIPGLDYIERTRPEPTEAEAIEFLGLKQWLN